MGQYSPEEFPSGYGAVNVPGVDSSVYGLALEDCPKRVRVYFDDECVVDSRNVKLMHETDRPPVYYFPVEDVEEQYLEESAYATNCPHKGEARYWHITTETDRALNAVWRYPDPIEECPDISGHLAFEWNSMDEWYEEDQQVYLHPADPYKRIDVRESSRHVRIVLEGELLAESKQPVLLFETGAPTRFYLPKTDVQRKKLVSSETRTVCCYKGFASDYWHADLNGTIHEDIAWSYRNPNEGFSAIANKVAFFHRKVELTVDSSKFGHTN